MKQLHFYWIYSGLNDYIRGIIAAHQRFGDVAEIVPVISPKHIFSQIFSWANPDKWDENTYQSLSTPEWRFGYSDEEQDAVRTQLKTMGVVSMTNLAEPAWDDNCRNFRWLLEPIPEYLDIIKQRLQVLDGIPYDVVSIRIANIHVGSDIVISDKVIEQVIEQVNNIIYNHEEQNKNQSGRLLIMSDYKPLNSLISEKYTDLTRQYLSAHSCPVFNPNLTLDRALDILTKVHIIIGARTITCITEHEWGFSGFTKVPAMICGIPLRNVVIR